MDSRVQGPISENLSSIDRKLDGLQDCRLKIGHIEEVLLRLQASISSQTALLHEVQKQVGLRGTTEEVQRVMCGSNNLTKGSSEFESAVATPPVVPQPVSILKKTKVQTEDDIDLVPLPEDQPQAFAVVPSQVNQKEGRLSRLSRTSVGSQKSSQGAALRSTPEQESPGQRLSVVSHMSSLQKRGNNSVDSAEAASVDELSLKTTRKLLRGFSALSATCPLDEQGRNETKLSSTARSSKQSSRVAVLENLEKTQNISLDELRTNHNALVTAMSMRSVSTLDTGSGMLFTAELLLVLAGVMEMWSPWLGLLWVCFLFVLFLGGTGALVWWSGVARVLEADSALASFCYMAGVAASIWMLRRRNIQELLKDDESSLDMYARQAGFIAVWRRKSQKQFIKATGCLILLCVSRCLAYIQAPVSSHELIQTSTFCFASIGFVAVTYLQLHISKGLELAIDSFAVNFFKEMDFEKALAEWNVLQAMLRHVSTKLSGSLLMLGVSSGSSILYLIELSFVRTDVGGGFGFILKNLWSLPPIILFLYTMMRAAAVTEKASRVSPLVNSWTFEDKEPFGDEEEQVWMDLERQYLVQYINQSEAGFYVQGVKIRNFQVTKMCYYLGAILFTIVSQSAM